MKVNLVSAFNKNCGIGQYSQNLVSAMSTQLDQITAFRKDDTSLPLFHTYPYRSFRGLQHYVAPYYLQKAIRNEKADIWHADHVSSFLALDSARIKSPIIVTAHDAIPFFYNSGWMSYRFYRYQLKRTYMKANYIIVVSEAAKKDLLRMTGFSSKKIIAIPNGIQFPTESLVKVSSDKGFKIRYLGGLGAKHKNVDLLLHTAKLLEDRKIKFQLEIGGYMPEKFHLRDLSKKLGLRSVRFRGFIPDHEKVDFLSNCDLFAYPSLMEGFGFPPMEALACKTPVIASDIPVFRELLAEGVILVKPTARHFAKEIINLVNAPGKLEEYRQKGYEQVRKYTWEKTAAKTIETYKRSLL